jgi:pilus assembly protein CpaC
MNRSRASLVRWCSVVALAALAVANLSTITAGQAPAAPAAGQTPPPAPPAPVAPSSVGRETDGGRVRIIAGRSSVLSTDFDIRRMSLTDATVADGSAVSPRELLIHGKRAGTISLIVWGDSVRVHYELVVEPAVTTLEQRLHELFPGEDIHVSVSEGAVVMSGRASTNEVMLRAGEVAALSLPNQKVINMLALPGGEGSQQVMLQVRVAEVNRRAVQELGLSLFTTRDAFTSRSTTQGFPAPDFDDQNGGFGGLTFSDYLNLFFFQRNIGIGGVLKALGQSGNLQSLAEPNLIAYNGKEASVLVGGEIPVPVVSGASGNVSVSWKEFGVRLKFVPTIAGDVIRLKVRPEVSALDFANGVTLGGFRIPALSTRYADTEVELRDGQSFAIAGLLNTVGQHDQAAIPYLSAIPVIGKLFQSKTKRSEATELMVLVTPRLVRPWNPDEVPPLPTTLPPGEAAGTPSAITPSTTTPPAEPAAGERRQGN